MGFQYLFCSTSERCSRFARHRLPNISRLSVFNDVKPSKTLNCSSHMPLITLAKPLSSSVGVGRGVTSLYNWMRREGTRSLCFGLCSLHLRMLNTQTRCHLLKKLHQPTIASRSFSTSVAKDVILFEHDRTRFFRLLAVFCGGQLLFWTYLAHFAFTGLRDTRGSDSGGRKVATTGLAGFLCFDMNLGSNAWRYGFTLACLVIGGGIVGLGLLFCRRSVSQVILHKGGGMVTVSTQSPLGPNKWQRMTIPLSQVTCHAHRQESPSFIPLRVKGHKFYFLLDNEGTLNNPKLFDVTVGAYRPF